MTKSKKIMFGIFVFLATAGVVFRWYNFFTGPRVKQPLEYSHKVHTEMLKCEECHTGVINSASATIPDIKVCMGCHKDEPLSNSPVWGISLAPVAPICCGSGGQGRECP